MGNCVEEKLKAEMETPTVQGEAKKCSIAYWCLAESWGVNMSTRIGVCMESTGIVIGF